MSKRLIGSKLPFMDACESIACLLMRSQDQKSKAIEMISLTKKLLLVLILGFATDMCVIGSDDSIGGKFEKEEHDLQQIFKRVVDNNIRGAAFGGDGSKGSEEEHYIQVLVKPERLGI